MHNATVTVFNRYYSKQLKAYTWYPHVLSGVYFNADKSANVEKTGLENADTAKLHIPYKLDGERVLIGDLEYMTPKAWEQQPNDSYDNIITFKTGEDFFILGDFASEPINDDDEVFNQGTYTGFEDYMNRYFDDVYSITTVGKYDLIPHFEIGGA